MLGSLCHCIHIWPSWRRGIWGGLVLVCSVGKFKNWHWRPRMLFFYCIDFNCCWSFGSFDGGFSPASFLGG